MLGKVDIGWSNSVTAFRHNVMMKIYGQSRLVEPQQQWRKNASIINFPFVEKFKWRQIFTFVRFISIWVYMAGFFETPFIKSVKDDLCKLHFNKFILSINFALLPKIKSFIRFKMPSAARCPQFIAKSLNFLLFCYFSCIVNVMFEPLKIDWNAHFLRLSNKVVECCNYKWLSSVHISSLFLYLALSCAFALCLSLHHSNISMRLQKVCERLLRE